MIVVSDLPEGRELGVEGGNQRNFGVRNSSHGLFLQGCVSGDGFGSGNGLFHPMRAMPPHNQMVLQHLCMTGEIRFVRTNPSETKGLAESYPCLAMARVAA